MGRQKNHRAKWLSNRGFIEEIPSTRSDWAATVTFYTALHAVEWLFAVDKAGPHTSHKARDVTLANSRYDSIRDAYKVLKNISWLARYDSAPQAVASITVQDVRNRLIDKYLAEIETFVLAEVGYKGQYKPKAIVWPPKQ